MIVVASGLDISQAVLPSCRCNVCVQPGSNVLNDETLPTPCRENDVEMDRTVRMHFLSIRPNEVPDHGTSETAMATAFAAA